jgi:hypothetical protein
MLKSLKTRVAYSGVTSVPGAAKISLLVNLRGSKYTSLYLNTCPDIDCNAESCDTERVALSHACAHVQGSSFVLLCSNVTRPAGPICHASRSGSGIHHCNNDMWLGVGGGWGGGSFCYLQDCEKIITSYKSLCFRGLITTHI